MISGVNISAWSFQTQYGIMSGSVAVFLSAFREFHTCFSVISGIWISLLISLSTGSLWQKLNFKESMSTTLFINILSLCVFTCLSVFQPSSISPFVQCDMFFAVVLGSVHTWCPGTSTRAPAQNGAVFRHTVPSLKICSHSINRAHAHYWEICNDRIFSYRVPSCLRLKKIQYST